MRFEHNNNKVNNSNLKILEKESDNFNDIINFNKNDQNDDHDFINQSNSKNNNPYLFTRNSNPMSKESFLLDNKSNLNSNSINNNTSQNLFTNN
jgi:hypothetical protein